MKEILIRKAGKSDLQEIQRLLSTYFLVLELHSIAVHPNFRGKGIETRLVKRLLTTIDEPACDLYVRTTAPQFFEKLNFEKIKNLKKLLLWEDCKMCEHFEKCTQFAMRYSCN